MQLSEINHDMENISVDLKSNSGKAPGANFKQKYIVYVENRLIQFSNAEEPAERGILNIKYARLKKTHLKDANTKLFGFILMAKGVCL